MSILTIIRQGRQQAKAHQAKKEELKKKEEAKTPYKHVPSHAAIDAMSAGPSTYRDSDLPRIMEQNKRRSAMTASGIGMGMGGMMTPVHAPMTRANSSLSYMSYPSAHATPVVQMQRNYSYTGVGPAWVHPGSDAIYPTMEATTVPSKGKEVERVIVQPRRESRSSSKGGSHTSSIHDGSPAKQSSSNSSAGSSADSNSSQDDLHMKTSKASRHMSDTPEYSHRLHPSNHSRRLSDPSLRQYPSQSSRTNQDPSAKHYPPQSSRSVQLNLRNTQLRPTSTIIVPSEDVPPVPALPAFQFGQFGQFAATPRAISTSSGVSTASATPVVSTDSFTLPPTKTESPAVADDIAVAIGFSPEEQQGEGEGVEVEIEEEHVGTAVSTPLASPTQSTRSQSFSQPMVRFPDFDAVSPYASTSVYPAMDFTPVMAEKFHPAVGATRINLPTRFDEANFPQQPQVLPPPKHSKLAKSSEGVPKPAKKARWLLRGGSLRGNKAAAVAG